MKKSKILRILAAATATVCLCGVFFSLGENSTPAPASAVTPRTEAEFSSDKAKSALHLCAVASYPETLQAKLSELGYQNFRYYCREQEGTQGSGIAFGIATQKGETHTRVTAVFRGTNKCEWYSNFSIGEESEHAGFSAATDFALEKLQEYLREFHIEEETAEMLVSGHSRGGAAANLLAQRLADKGDFRQICAYTFASPCTTTSRDAKNPRYNSIFNILNPEDFICYIPPRSWGYTRYGIDLEFPKEDAENFPELYEMMQKYFYVSAGFEHMGYEGHHRDVEDFLRAVTQIAPTVQDYYRKEIPLQPQSVTLSEYMAKAAALLSGVDTISNGMFLISGSNSPLLRPLTEFMMQGVDLEKIAESHDMKGSAIYCGHTYETYEGWLRTLPESYFADAVSRARNSAPNSLD